MRYISASPSQQLCRVTAQRWCTHRAFQWYRNSGWITGCNYIPATAINQLEMWQAETFDIACIDKELSWAQNLGFNTVRVFLHHLLWQQDSAGFINRINQFLSVADKHNIKAMFVMFDSVWNPYPQTGKQPTPKLFIHNSGWVQSPGAEILKKVDSHDSLRGYIEGVIDRFKNDDRILLWDLFNEPDNTNDGSYKNEVYNVPKAKLALQLLKKTFAWARAINPQQPLTAAPWRGNWENPSYISELDNYMFANSDIISFHSYENKDGLEKRIQCLQRYNRPIICSEYMARHLESTFENILPLLHKYNVGAINWGLVAGKTQTHCPWNSWEIDYGQEPATWFHDIFRSTGEPYDANEVSFIESFLRKRDVMPYQQVA